MLVQSICLSVADKKICNDLCFTLKPGQCLGLLGANGVGKTRLLHSLGALLPINSGEILIAEKNLQNYKTMELAEKIALLPQDTVFEFPATVRDTVLLGCYPRRQYWQQHISDQENLFKKILHAFELENLEQHCVTRLSGGERRRVGLAQLAMQEADIYLLDEPTNHLDVRHQLAALKYFTGLAKILIMSLHDINLAKRFCTHILLLLDGKHYFGTVEDILKPELLYSAFRQEFVLREDVFIAV